MMNLDPLKQYARLRDTLLSEKVQIESRLNAINGVLEAAPTGASVAARSLDRVAGEHLDTTLSGYTPRPGTLPAKILKALATNRTGMQVKDIAIAVKTKPALVSQSCLMLLKKG